jgi:hypothetical protein
MLLVAAVGLLSGRAFPLELVKDGKAVSAIVISDNATQLEQQAAAKLAEYLKTSSGARVAIVKESAKPAGTLISMGKTAMAEQAGITDAGLKHDGYRLLAKGSTLFLLGRDTNLLRRSGAQGSLRAVFGFLDRLGFRWLQPTPAGTYVPQLKTVSVPDNLNVTYEPPMMFMHGRMDSWGDWSMANSFRTAVKMFAAGETWVNGVPAKLFKQHPEYFQMKGGKRVEPADPGNPQYCMSNPDAQRLVAEWAMKNFDDGCEIVALGQSDGFQACQCEACSKLSPSDQVHNALRNVAEMTAKKYPDRKLHVLIYAPANYPPSQFKMYPPNTIGHVCLTETLQTAIGSHDKALDYWRSAIPGGITIYSYNMGLYYDNGLSPRFYPALAAAKIKNWVAHGVQGIYWCGGGENWGAEGPTFYTIGRMVTDPTLDAKQVYEEYISLTFRKAAPAMKQYYDTLYERQERFRHHMDDWVVAGIGTPNDTFAGTYSADVIVKLKNSLEAAKKQAAGDERALGWIRLAEISYNQYALIARAFHFYQSCLLNPSADNLRQVCDAVKAYEAFADETMAMAKREKAFTESFFPNVGVWTNEKLKTNYGHLRCAPFTWDLEKKMPKTR